MKNVLERKKKRSKLWAVQRRWVKWRESRRGRTAGGSAGLGSGAKGSGANIVTNLGQKTHFVRLRPTGRSRIGRSGIGQSSILGSGEGGLVEGSCGGRSWGGAVLGKGVLPTPPSSIFVLINRSDNWPK